MAHRGPICRMFAKTLTPVLQRMTKGERAVFLLDIAWEWGIILHRHRQVMYPRKKKKSLPE